jgi:hypothetical protein
MIKPLSFLCEHSVEYVLVHDIVKRLSLEYDRIIPIYFWVNREGTSIASKGIGRNSVRIITVYARRPKVKGPHDTSILMKINNQLFKAAELASSLGSPVLAGIPLTTNLLQFNMSTLCSWFQLQISANRREDVEIQLALDGTLIDHNNISPAVNGPLTTENILSIIKTNTHSMSWGKAVNSMRIIRDNERYTRFMSGYRPFYLVIPS